ncbi:alanine racemase [Wenzhouxiangella limi]|uniref:Alanine racemase n=1 Tax=Wenzhouxiangella limi TaxID=2707351 RepID=A0A845UVH4_9GAMM|nr:alanine racemase [Wenzhouxiangella limi]
MARNTLARIEPDAVAHNLAVVRRQAPRSRVMAVVKADAYGHRIDLVLPALEAADMLAVATLDEARAIRRLGNRQPVLLLEGVLDSSDLAVAESLGLELTLHHPDQVEMLARYGHAPTPRLWLKVDSGMHRLGVEPARVAELHGRLKALPGVKQVNLVSHFASAEDPDDRLVREQIARFDAAVVGLDGEHCLANSAAILEHPDAHRDWVRAGVLLYGISPLPDRTGPDLDLQPAMSLQAELLAINRVPAGESIGYGARFTAERDLRVGVAGIGYGDGYPRSVADGTPVLVGDKLCRVVGRVSMDMVTLDLAACPEARIGDRVVLWGRGLPVETVADGADTIPYELVCRITRRVRYRALPFRSGSACAASMSRVSLVR